MTIDIEVKGDDGSFTYHDLSVEEGEKVTIDLDDIKRWRDALLGDDK